MLSHEYLQQSNYDLVQYCVENDIKINKMCTYRASKKKGDMEIGSVCFLFNYI